MRPGPALTLPSDGGGVDDIGICNYGVGMRASSMRYTGWPLDEAEDRRNDSKRSFYHFRNDAGPISRVAEYYVRRRQICGRPGATSTPP